MEYVTQRKNRQEEMIALFQLGDGTAAGESTNANRRTKSELRMRAWSQIRVRLLLEFAKNMYGLQCILELFSPAVTFI